MANIFAFRGMVPVIDPTAFVHPMASLIGDVIVGPGVFVGPGASLRGDFGRLVLERGSNFQDNCIMHGFPDIDTVVEENGHVGHGAIVHGGRIGSGALIGMNAVVNDYAEIGADAVVAAMAFVKARDVVPPRTLVAGIPARAIRELSAEEVAAKNQGTRDYQNMTQDCLRTLEPAAALTEIEPDRPRDYAETMGPLEVAKPKMGGK